MSEPSESPLASIGVAVPLLVKWFRRRAGKQAGPEFVRGSRLVDPEAWNRLLKKSRLQADLPLGNLRLPVSSEVKHVLTVGRRKSGPLRSREHRHAETRPGPRRSDRPTP